MCVRERRRRDFFGSWQKGIFIQNDSADRAAQTTTKKKKQHNTLTIIPFVVTLEFPSPPNTDLRPIMAVEPRRRAQSGIRSPFETKAQTRGPPERVSNSPTPSSQNDPTVPVSIELLLLSPPCGRRSPFLSEGGAAGRLHTETLTRRPQTGHENSGRRTRRAREDSMAWVIIDPQLGGAYDPRPSFFTCPHAHAPRALCDSFRAWPQARPPACKCCRRIDPD